MSNLPAHLFVSSTDGALHDTRVPNWSSSPLRAPYCRHFPTIKTAAEFKATLRAGAYVWPGGYPLMFLTDEGDCISFKGARQNARDIMDSLAHNARRSGFFIVSCVAHMEGAPEYCALTGEAIESAYGAPDDETGEGEAPAV
jgi:hypothetical protein